jgi:transcriptional regulator with XRE-family HTH domain
MAAMSTKKRSPVQQGIIALRRKLGMSQQDLAVAMDKNMMSISRWETSREPRGYSLLQLSHFAHSQQAPEIAQIFEDALRTEGTPESLMLTLPDKKTSEQAEALFRFLGVLQLNTDIPEVKKQFRTLLEALQQARFTLLKHKRLDPEVGSIVEIALREAENNPVYEQLQEDIQHAEAKRARTKKKR